MIAPAIDSVAGFPIPMRGNEIAFAVEAFPGLFGVPGGLTEST